MTRIFTLLAFMLISSFASAQLLITEIMYNPPESGQDSLEFIEIYNAGADAVDVTGYSMVGVTYEFPAGLIPAGDYYYISVNTTAFFNAFGTLANQSQGALSNGGEDVSIRDADNNIIHEVDYDDAAPWPTEEDGTDGAGSSIALCDFDNPSMGESWKASKTPTGAIIDQVEILASINAQEIDGCIEPPSGIIVTTEGLAFVPKDITINQGETITFINGGGTHNANGGQDVYPNNPEGFTSGAPSSDIWEYDFTFGIAGFYEYQCDLHAGAGMVGTVTVLAPEDNSDLRITEVFYNSNISPDSLEYIEVYNAGTDATNLSNLTLTAGSINSALGDLTVMPGQYVVVCKNLNALNSAFPGVSNAVEWGDGTLNNQGDNIVLTNTMTNEVVLDVVYDDDAPWPIEADGFGASLILCDPTGPFDESNIQAATYPTVTFEGNDYTVSPGEENYCSFAVGDITQNDSEGVNTSNGNNAILEGTVYGINIRPGSGLQFFIIDDNNDGISAFHGNDDYGYTLVEGDRLQLFGNIGQFNGLSQIYLDTLIVLGTSSLEPATVVTTLGEETESQFIKIENVTMVNTDQWIADGNSFNFDVTDGTTVFSIRMDNDVMDITSLTYPTGSFSITGLGNQYDEQVPYTTGYQLLPRYKTDIDPFIPYVNTYPPVSIGDTKMNNADGEATMLGENVTLEGTVYGINLRATGLEFTLIDGDGDGIYVFSANEAFGYTVNEGNNLQIKGEIDQFNGLTEIIPDSLFTMGDGTLLLPNSVTVLDESTESSLVKIANTLTLTDANDWKGDGTTFTVTGTDGTNNYSIVIDNDTELSSLIFPGQPFDLTGIGSQRDVSSPYDEGYRILPRYNDDVQFIVKNNEELFGSITLQPNPASDVLFINYDQSIREVYIFDQNSKMILKTKNSKIDVSNLASGVYSVRVFTNEGIVTKPFVKLEK